MKKFIVFLCLVASGSNAFISAQNIAINTTGADPDGSAMLDISGANHGLLVPRVALTATGAAGPVTSPAVSLLVYNTATVSDVTPGYYYWNGTTWVRFFDSNVNSADHDWYEVGGTDSPNSINDNIFTEGNVGIGDASPISRLTIKDGGISIDNDGDNDWAGIGELNGGLVLSGRANAVSNPHVIVDHSGNVGVGTTTPSEKLEITDGGIQLNLSNGIGFRGEIPRDGNVSSIDGVKMFYDDSFFGASLDALVIEKTDFNSVNPDGGIAFTNKGSDNVSETSMVIKGGGNVGIGTTSPTTNLDVMSDVIGLSDVLSLQSAPSAINVAWKFAIGNKYSLAAKSMSIYGTSNSGGDFAINPSTALTTPPFVIKGTNGYVGIGTTSPSSPLEIFRTGSSSILDMLVLNSFGNSGLDRGQRILFRTQSNATTSEEGGSIVTAGQGSGSTYMAFSTKPVGSSLSEKMRIDKDGRVGIGTTLPVANFSTGTPATKFAVNAGNSSGYIEVAHFAAGADADNTGAIVRIGQVDNDRGLYIKSGREILNRSIATFGLRDAVPSDVDMMTFRQNGSDYNVGIGTLIPNEALEVNGSIRMTDGNEASGRILVSDANGTGSWQEASSISPSSIEDADGDTKIQVEENTDDDNIRFDTRGSERMIVDSLGRVGIGTTAPSQKLDVSSGNIELNQNYGIGTNIGSTTVEYIIQPVRTGIQSLAGIGADSPHNTSLSLESDQQISFIETDADKLVGYMDVNDNEFIWNGNVGIGTTSPGEKLEVDGNVFASGTNTNSILGANGNIELFRDSASSSSNSVNGYIDFKEIASRDRDLRLAYYGKQGTKGAFVIETSTDGVLPLIRFSLLNENGNVGIGTTSPSEKLEVSGNVLATSFIATTAGAGAYQYNSGANMTVPDYVFEKHFKGESKINPEYKMYSLKEIEKYIERHQHLPRVPSRKALLKDGVMNIQGMQMVTLEKVEELFIHSISQEKEILAQKKKLLDQEVVINNNKNEIEILKQMILQMQDK